MTGSPTVKIRYRRLRRSLLISAPASASVPSMSDHLLCRGASRGVVFGGDGDERLLQAQAGYLDLARPVPAVQHRVQRRVGVGHLELDEISTHLQVDQPWQAEQERLVHRVEPERHPARPGALLYLGRRAVGEQPAPVDYQDPVRRMV